ncbi:exosome component 10-like [Polyodon spathula]|uniref:exosome component 10-like n=1 Tax=Polyodon spathula TaxID=7913 RepID=UPI001B7E294D|nr:exosome component 10-like [Polyodon spathula]
MAASRAAAVGAKQESVSVENDETTSEVTEVFPGFKDADSFVKYGLGTVVAATKASANLPQAGDEHDFYRSFPGFQGFCETQGERLLQCMSRIMQYHGCRSHMRDRNQVTGLEDRFDLLVDSNDVILEKVGILLDEASGVNRKQPILPAGVQPPKTIVSSWNRKGGALGKRNKCETFRLLHAKNIQRPQMKFRERVDNANTPFVPKIFAKPNALKPLPVVLANRKLQNARPEDLDVPPALADFIHQQRYQQQEEDMFSHPYKYELDQFTPDEKLLSKPEPQMYKPLQETDCHFVTTLEELVELNEKLAHCSEFAVDLEHHSYRSFLGLTCLMQISTRDEDFIIDTLELRSEMYILNETFTDPSIVKVFHGADSDIEWLQRDFGLYVVNLFDTHQASRLLNLGRNSLEHLMKLFCNVEADKQYQLADWRIRPLPEEMLNYARDDTHYLLYIYDKMRAELYEKGNAQPALLQMAWQKSKDVSLKKYIKPIFTEDSYQDLYRKQKKPLDTQQLTAFRLLYAWRDQISRQEDESTGYVLPNHMLIKISEELPKEPQGIIACCNPVPPLVRQQVNELHLLMQQAREMPLLKTEVQTTEKKTATTLKRKSENPLFGPHDSSHISESEIPNSHSAAPLLKRGKLFSEDEEMEEGKEVQDCSPLIARATITIFDFESDVKEENHLTVAQQKSHCIMQSFENPFRMYLPSKETNIHISRNAKYDPSSKVYEISNRWKLLSQELQQKEAKEKAAAKAAAKEAAQKAADERKKAQEEYKTAAQSIVTVRQQAAVAAAEQKGNKKKKERSASEPGAGAPKQEKKRPKDTEQPAEHAPATDFQPFDYSKSDFKVFAGRKSKESSQFDPAKQAQDPKQSKKNSKAHRNNSTPGNKSMSYLAGKSDRGFKHNWPKR